MGKTTKIQYVHSTVNPSEGCGGCELWKPGARVCYAGYATERYKGPNVFDTMSYHPKRIAEAAKWGPPTEAERAAKPYLDVAGRRIIFVSDTSDLLTLAGFNGDKVAMFKWLYAVCVKAFRSEEGRRHLWLWFSKRMSIMAEFSAWMRKHFGHDWPINVVPFTSVTSSKYLRRIDHMLEIGAKAYGVSCEPLWSEIDLEPYIDRLSWVVAGAQSESSKIESSLPVGDRILRPSHSSWFLRIRDLCVARRKPFFFKQWGALVPANPHEQKGPKGLSLWVARDGRVERSMHPDGHFDRRDEFEFQRCVGKHNSHRLLDGVEWNGVPTFEECREPTGLFGDHDEGANRKKPMGRASTPWE